MTPRARKWITPRRHRHLDTTVDIHPAPVVLKGPPSNVGARKGREINPTPNHRHWFSSCRPPETSGENSRSANNGSWGMCSGDSRKVPVVTAIRARSTFRRSCPTPLWSNIILVNHRICLSPSPVTRYPSRVTRRISSLLLLRHDFPPSAEPSRLRRGFSVHSYTFPHPVITSRGCLSHWSITALSTMCLSNPNEPSSRSCRPTIPGMSSRRRQRC